MRLFLAALVIAAMAWSAGVKVTHLGNLLGAGHIELGWLSVAFTVVCSVGLINAMNMADGVDGLAAGLGVTSLTALLAAAWLITGTFPPELPVLIAAIGGFWALNARHPFNARAIAFLGDSGSMLLGVSLAWYAMALSQGSQAVLPPASILWILGLPVIDALRVMCQRAMKRKVSPFAAGRDHLHHILQGFGWSPATAAWTLVATNALFCLIGVMGAYYRWPEAIMTYSFLSLAGGFWLLTPQSRFIGPCGTDMASCTHQKGDALPCQKVVACKLSAVPSASTMQPLQPLPTAAVTGDTDA